MVVCNFDQILLKLVNASPWVLCLLNQKVFSNFALFYRFCLKTHDVVIHDFLLYDKFSGWWTNIGKNFWRE